MITLKTLPKVTAQKVFDQVKQHLLTQGKQAINVDGTCAYLTSTGLKCAAGCLIGEDEYTSNWEHSCWRSLVDQLRVPSTHSDLIKSLQQVHDEWDSLEWPEKLQEVAKKYNLQG